MSRGLSLHGFFLKMETLPLLLGCQWLLIQCFERQKKTRGREGQEEVVERGTTSRHCLDAATVNCSPENWLLNFCVLCFHIFHISELGMVRCLIGLLGLNSRIYYRACWPNRYIVIS